MDDKGNAAQCAERGYGPLDVDLTLRALGVYGLRYLPKVSAAISEGPVGSSTGVIGEKYCFRPKAALLVTLVVLSRVSAPAM